MSNASQYTSILKSFAAKYGFEQLGIAKAEKLDGVAPKLEQWLNNGHHGSMAYLEDHFDKKIDPRLLMPGLKSIISFTYNYFPEDDALSTGPYKIARYAYGRDYHKVVKNKLKKLLQELKAEIGDFNAKYFVDAAPILEREWAERAGLGWKGKNTLLINEQKGSYFFIGEIICDIELDYGHPISDRCGTCTKCIDACPTDAIAENGYILDASKCISYLTIEKKSNIPDEFKKQMEDWIYGCDICQEVCPWNRFASPHQEPDFLPNVGLSALRKKDWEDLSEEAFDEIFFASPIKRTQYKGIKRNVNFIQSNKK